ncbi:MAG: Fe-S protein assembly chaperone HscA, partial [Chitinophagaceae bacterium]|nr:Fe-S protein assembly chaperone HscA [Rubrivivax sp.]
QRMTLATRSALAADAALLSDADQGDIEALLTRLQAVAQGKDAHAITAAIEALAEGTEAFAAARMNQGIRKALAGRSLDQI